MFRGVSCALGVALLAPGALAQAPEAAPAEPGAASAPSEATLAPAAPSPPVVVPPRLVQFVPAEYPPRALEQRLGARVPLELTIDTTGHVTQVVVREPQGHGFDEAARAAAARYVFEPATRNGAAVAVRIRYELEFTPESEPTVPPAETEAPGAPAAPPDAPAPAAAAPGAALASRSSTAEIPAAPEVDGPSPPGGEVHVEVRARGSSAADRLRQSAESVQVVETERAQLESADLGEVLRRSSGIGLRREGGLGSSTRLSLGGMTDSQIRFFLDGVPLDFAGFGLGVSVVPLSLVERIETYRGVVPIRFGADALGGAVNLVSDESYRETRLDASFQVGSFGLYRATAGARHRFPESPFVINAAAFLDRANNDYEVDVEVPNAVGRLETATVRRFHDAYRATGGNVELGVVSLPWARRLLLRLHATEFEKELQHNAVMTVPYGEVESGEGVIGATLRYDVILSSEHGLVLDAVAGYSRRRISFDDRSEWVYDWFGRRILSRVEPGEIDGADDLELIEHRTLARLGLVYRPLSEHAFRLSSTLNGSARQGRDALYESPNYLDPASAEQRLLTIVSGFEYELDALGDRLENIAFAKSYYYRAAGEQGDFATLAPVETGFAELVTDSATFGGGDALRYRLADAWLLKGSYEYATRLPSTDEVYGDGVLELANLELEPEVSHNLNLGLSADDVQLGRHSLHGEVNVFYRDADRLIFQVPVATDFAQSFNMWSSRARGVEASLGWVSPGSYVALDGNVTYADVRNTSSSGPFADFEGERIPNRPWLYANATARFQLSALATPDDELSLTWYSNYVHGFFRSWEGAGRPDYKIEIDDQLLHSAALVYVLRSAWTLSSTLEVQNLTDARAYDYFGVQKPGRAFYFKGTVSY